MEIPRTCARYRASSTSFARSGRTMPITSFIGPPLLDEVASAIRRDRREPIRIGGRSVQMSERSIDDGHLRATDLDGRGGYVAGAEDPGQIVCDIGGGFVGVVGASFADMDVAVDGHDQ